MTYHDPEAVSHDVSSSGATDGLTVVIPAYNEGTWVGRAVTAVRQAAAAAQWGVRIVVVDDGSTDAQSVDVVNDLDRAPDVEVVRQSNSGRFAARAKGIAAVSTPYVLLLDSRVEVDVDSLRRIREAVETEGLEVWNYDVTPGSRSLGAMFWTGITKVWWPDYFRNPRRVSFGAHDFGRFPKGTGAFFAPLALLREAMEEFDSHFDDPSLASDDTRLLLGVASRRPITLSPEVTCRHHVKSGVRSWCRQCFYRGTTFVDGYLGERNTASRLLGVMAMAAVAGGALTVRRPRLAAGALVAGGAAGAGATRRSGGSAAESASVGLLSGPFGVLFAAGIVRGLRMATQPRAATGLRGNDEDDPPVLGREQRTSRPTG
jgi:glycosyltransferase involved in cell wall biosynthesis